MQLERHYSKDRILELYLNAIYFGNGAYGVEAAAEQYFREDVGRAHPGRGRTPRRPHPAADRQRPVRQPQGRPGPAGPRAAAHAEERLRHRHRGRGGRHGDPLHLGGPTVPAQERYSAPYFVDSVKSWILHDPRFGATAQSPAGPALRRRASRSRPPWTSRTRPPPRPRPTPSSRTPPPTPTSPSCRSSRRPAYVRAMVGGRDFFGAGGAAKLNLANAPVGPGPPGRLVVQALRPGRRP